MGREDPGSILGDTRFPQPDVSTCVIGSKGPEGAFLKGKTAVPLKEAMSKQKSRQFVFKIRKKGTSHIVILLLSPKMFTGLTS